MTDDWRSDAACAGTPTAIWFPEALAHGGRAPDRTPGRYDLSYAQARRICQVCPSITQCRDEALTYGEQYGMWGGMTPRERAAHHRANGRAGICEQCGIIFSRRDRPRSTTCSQQCSRKLTEAKADRRHHQTTGALPVAADFPELRWSSISHGGVE